MAIEIDTQSPFREKPKTTQNRDSKGLPFFIVTPRTLTPLRARIADALGGLSVLSLIAGSAWYLNGNPGTDWTVAAPLLAGPFIVYPALKKAWGYLLKTKRTIILTPALFKFKTRRGWRSYDRTLPHSFALIAHDKTKAEQKQLAYKTRLAQADGEIINPTEYFGESCHLCFVHVGHRVDVMTIHGRKEAQAVLARLKACDGVLDAHCGMAQGLALTPRQETVSQPGDLPIE